MAQDTALYNGETDYSVTLLEILRHLSEWLLCKPEGEIEGRYRGMGRVRAGQNVSLVDFCWSMIFTKEQIWGFVQQQGYLQSLVEIYGEMELLRLLDKFFERAVCYGAEGYETGGTQVGNGEPPLAKIAYGGKHCVSS